LLARRLNTGTNSGCGQPCVRPCWATRSSLGLNPPVDLVVSWTVAHKARSHEHVVKPVYSSPSVSSIRASRTDLIDQSREKRANRRGKNTQRQPRSPISKLVADPANAQLTPTDTLQRGIERRGTWRCAIAHAFVPTSTIDYTHVAATPRVVAIMPGWRPKNRK
jgi:hypothetical protein